MKLDYVQGTPRLAVLRGSVVSYTGFHERTDGPLARREPPAGHVHVILSFGPHVRLLPQDAKRRSFAVGLFDEAGFYAHDGEQDGVEIRLTPPAARRLLGMPLGELSNQVVELDDVVGPAAGELAERLHDAPGWDTRFALLDHALATGLGDAPPVKRELEWAWRRLAATHGRARVGDLAAELGYSRRHLTDRFRRELGLPPKALAKVLRFERARALIEGGTALADVAHDCGYYDQAHLNRDFRELAGITPTALLATRIPEGGLVAFVQDADVRAA